MATRTSGFTAAVAGLTLLAAVLIGGGTTTTHHYWSKPAVLGSLAISAVLTTIGLWALGSVYLGWPWLATHDERRAAREQREVQHQIEQMAWQDAIQELIDELENNARDLGTELKNGRVFGGMYPASAWAKNANLLNGAELARVRRGVRDAYQMTHALNQEIEARYSAATSDDVNDSEWVKLTGEEREERHEALTAVIEARDALLLIQDSPPTFQPQPPKDRGAKVAELTALIHEGRDLLATLPQPAALDELGVLQARFSYLPRVVEWDTRTWRWVDANSHKNIGYLIRYQDNPKEEISSRAMPKFVQRRLEALEKVQDQL
jgi:hypothetical protein